MESNLSMKKIAAVVSAAVLFLLLLSFALLAVLNRKPCAAFYGISERTQNAMEAVLQQTAVRRKGKSQPYEVVRLDDALPLADALKKVRRVDVLFIHAGCNADVAAARAKKKKSGFEPGILSKMTTSVKQAAQPVDGRIAAVPLLIDHCEIDINRNAFSSSGMEELSYWSDLETFADKTRASSLAAAVFAGADDASLVNVFGAMTEALSGVDSWNRAVAEIQAAFAEGGAAARIASEAAARLLQKDGALYEAGNTVRRWIDIGIFPKNVMELTMDDIEFYMTHHLSQTAFMTLSDHRTLPIEALSEFTSIYYPSRGGTVRHFTAPVIFAVPLTKNKTARSSIRSLAVSLQNMLSVRTGLAPAEASAGVPDRQADDVRYWVAASEAPLPALSDAAFRSQAEVSAFARALRASFQ